ncbi:hypothetical protein GCM10027596_14580 [Nocardioides korecus]
MGGLGDQRPERRRTDAGPGGGDESASNLDHKANGRHEDPVVGPPGPVWTVSSPRGRECSLVLARDHGPEHESIGRLRP